MMTPSRRAAAATVAAVALVTAAPAGGAGAAPPPGDPSRPLSLTLDAGLVCDFAVSIKGRNARAISSVQDPRTGVTTTVVMGHRLTFTNVEDRRQKITFPSTLVTTVTTPESPGTSTSVTTGGSAILLFPGDRSTSPAQPAGPSAFLHLGDVVYHDTPGVDTLVSAEGPSTDICAELES